MQQDYLTLSIEPPIVEHFTDRSQITCNNVISPKRLQVEVKQNLRQRFLAVICDRHLNV
jgi:hypothetical protein